MGLQTWLAMALGGWLGAGLLISGCGDGQANGDGGQACQSHATSCSGSGNTSISICGDAGVWQVQPCESGRICLTSDAGTAKCAKVSCVPGAKTCSDDFTSIITCNERGTAGTPVACASSEVCVDGACQASTVPLGDFVELTAASQPLALPPGYYAAAIVNTNTTSDATIAYPFQVTGTVANLEEKSAALPPSPAPYSSLTRQLLRCGTPALHRKLSTMRPSPPQNHPLPPTPRPTTPGATSTFHLYDFTTGGYLARTGKLCGSGTTAYFWEDVTDQPGEKCFMSQNDLDEIKRRLDTGVLPRDIAIFGNSDGQGHKTMTDVDGNGHVDIFFTPLLPNQDATAFVEPYTLCDSGEEADFGEVIYTCPTSYSISAASLAGVIAHEAGHLVTLGRRYHEYISPANQCDAIPYNLYGQTYVVEGMAELAVDWTGQMANYAMAVALMTPEEISLARFLSDDYLADAEVNGLTYGTAAIIVEYLFDQAGAVTIDGPGSVTDQGGEAYIDNLTLLPDGLQRITPLDGRAVSEWYPDLAAALLLTFVGDGVSQQTANDRRLHFVATTPDATFSGFNGPVLLRDWCPECGGTGPFLAVKDWTARCTALRQGGMAFVAFKVDPAGGVATVSGNDNKVRLIRYTPQPAADE